MGKKYYKYNWHLLHLHVECTKCGNSIVLQDFDGNPACADCGNINKTTWSQVIKQCDVTGMNKAGSQLKKLLGTITGSVNTEAVKNITCYHCNQILVFGDQEDLKNYSCSSCNQFLEFKEYDTIEDLVFYRQRSGKPETQPLQMIAVRCVSCGAPLEADPLKNQFHCKFCNTDNILPASLRHKVILDNIYVSERLHKTPKLLAFEQDGKTVRQALNENGKSSFADEELNKILLNNKNDVKVYNIITQNYKYLPPDRVLEEIYSTTANYEIVNLTGTRLQKAPHEITARMEEVAPQLKKKEEIKLPVYHSKKRDKSLFKRPLMIVLFIVFIFTIIALINSYL